MCFSAEASFAVAAGLTPVAAFCVVRAARTDRRLLALAVWPAAFAVQQAAEGVLWRALDAGDADGVALASRRFLFFSHFFWPAWVPLTVLLIEPAGWRRRVLAALAAFGALFGASICFPALLRPDWLAVEVVRGSIEYHTTLIYDGLIGRTPLRVAYAVVVLSALFLSSHQSMAGFGVLILGAMAGALWGYPYAFFSVWCFFAAVLSLYVGGWFLTLRRASPA